MPNLQKPNDNSGYESDLVMRARAGDNEAFAELVDQYKRLIHYFIYQFASSASGIEGDDYFQEALIGLMKAVRTYDGVTSSFATYASSCIRNSIISAVRLAKKTGMQEILSLDDSGKEVPADGSPEQDFIDRESSAILYNKVISGLSAYEKTVFEYYLADFSTMQIAEKLNKSEKSIANAIFRIRNKIKAMLA